MSGAEGQSIQQVLAVLVTLLAVTGALHLLVRWLRESRPGLAIGVPLITAFAVRLAAAIVISLIGIDELRGPDENKFVNQAAAVSETPFLSGDWIEFLTGNLHQFYLTLQLFALDSPDLALRIAHIGLAVAGLALLAAAVYELAGSRAAMIVAWVLALEPTNVFYSEVLHKEANMLLAAGLVSLGGAMLWNRGEWRYLLPIVLGCLIAALTRFYAGAFLIAAGVAVVLHAWIRHRPPGEPRVQATAVTVLLLIAVGGPVAWMLTDSENLRAAQERQESGIADDANLPLERVDFSTRQGVLLAVPQRARDVLLRPYPWQLASTKQRIGVFGTLVMLATLAWLLAELIRSRRRIMERAGPLIYVGFFLLIAYCLSAVNAGTAFRYRTQLVAIALCLIVVLVQARAQRQNPGARAARWRTPAQSALAVAPRPPGTPAVGDRANPRPPKGAQPSSR